LRKVTFSTKWPLLFHAEGGQVEPVLGGSKNEFLKLRSLSI
jgi:hypothetical protein